MVKPIPDNVKDLLNELSSSQQVILRSYIASLRSDVVTLEEEALNQAAAAQHGAEDDSPHAHYHGHEKCTADHGHAHTDHDDHQEHKHSATEHITHEHHDHKDHNHHHDDHHEHEHTEHCSHDHKEKDHHEDDHHEHKHTEHCAHEHHDDHHQHEHHHDGGDDAMHPPHDTSDDVPDWKKKALSADPSAAPFGGNWHSESNVSATEATAASMLLNHPTGDGSGAKDEHQHMEE
jgi:hypothetical protein